MPAPPATVPRRSCDHHPARPAIGVCVITGQAICGECSTRYEGVNYSKEGLRLLHERRLAQSGGAAGPLRLTAAVLSTPALAYLVYAGYAQSAAAVRLLLRWGE